MAEINTEELSTIRGNIAIFKNVGALEDTAKELKVQSNSKYLEASALNLKVPKSMTGVTTKVNGDNSHQPASIKGNFCMAILIIIIMVIVFMQIPNILYYTKPFAKETTLLNIFNLERCSVR